MTEIIGSIPGFEISFSLDDPFRALELLQNRAADILITDIKMPGFSGLELSRKINHLEIPIIICSGHTEFGVESFKVNAIHFILKPPGMIEVSEALDKARSIISKTKSPEKEYHQDFILVRELGEFKHVFIKPLDIKYIEQKGELTWIYLDSGEFIRTRNRLYATIEKVNRPYIFKIHRSFAVNYLKIKSLDQGYCHFEENIKVPIGREYRQEFVEFLKSKTLT